MVMFIGCRLQLLFFLTCLTPESRVCAKELFSCIPASVGYIDVVVLMMQKGHSDH